MLCQVWKITYEQSIPPAVEKAIQDLENRGHIDIFKRTTCEVHFMVYRHLIKTARKRLMAAGAKPVVEVTDIPRLVAVGL